MRCGYSCGIIRHKEGGERIAQTFPALFILHHGGFMFNYLLFSCIAIPLIILCRSCYEVTHFIIKRYTFQNKNAVSPINLLYISDLHETRFGKENERLIQAVQKEAPDCIIIGGDLIIGKEKKIKTDVALEFLKKINGICPVLYNFGNHETRVRKTKEFQDYLKELDRLDITLLNNRGIHLNLKGTKIYFWGIELSKACYKSKKYTVKKNPFSAAKEDEIKILIAHNPNFFKEYAEWEPDYILSGHNHGGIIRLPMLNGVISTDKRFFPEYSYGLYQENQSIMVLSGGAGTHTIKFRLFNESEIVAVHIKNRKHGKGGNSYGNTSKASGV